MLVLNASQAALTPAELEQRVVFEDETVVVIDKPWGLPSTGRNLGDPRCLQYAVIQRYARMTWALHQLDADTSGLNVFVKRRDSVRRWQLRMRHPVGAKDYFAIVHGRVARDQAIDAPIGFVSHKPDCLGITAEGREARTRVEILDRTKTHTALRVRIETGRTHQIRIHCASIGHPLVGERWYCDPKCNEHERQALHAIDLRFADGLEPRALHAKLPADLLALLDRTGLSAGHAVRS